MDSQKYWDAAEANVFHTRDCHCTDMAGEHGYHSAVQFSHQQVLQADLRALLNWALGQAAKRENITNFSPEYCVEEIFAHCI